jgi:nucleoside-diphosphate-sugar epimerase
VYVEDVTRANVLALEDEASSGAYNVGTGSETSVNELTSCYWGSQVRILLLNMVRPSRASSFEARWILPSPGAS